jgi:hypothetical protein
MVFELALRKSKKGKVISHPSYKDPQLMAAGLNRLLDVSIKDVKKLMNKKHVRAQSNMGVIYLTLKIN